MLTHQEWLIVYTYYSDKELASTNYPDPTITLDLLSVLYRLMENRSANNPWEYEYTSENYN